MHEATLRAALLAAEAAAGQVVETPYVWDALDEGEDGKSISCGLTDPQKYLQMGEKKHSKRHQRTKPRAYSGQAHTLSAHRA